MSIVSANDTFVNSETTLKLTILCLLLGLNSFNFFMKCSVDFSILFCGKYGLIMLSKNFAKAYFGVFTIDTTGLSGQLGLWTFTVPYSFPGELPDGMRLATSLLS